MKKPIIKSQCANLESDADKAWFDLLFIVNRSISFNMILLYILKDKAKKAVVDSTCALLLYSNKLLYKSVS